MVTKQRRFVLPRTDQVMMSPPIILFDGICNLCNRGVDLVIRHDRRRVFRFASLQSPVAQLRLRQLGYSRDSMESVLLIEADRVSSESTAVLKIAGRLPWPWPLLAVFWLLPRPVRDWGYRIVARNRYRWFGQRSQCRMPTPEEKSLFL